MIFILNIMNIVYIKILYSLYLYYRIYWINEHFINNELMKLIIGGDYIII